MDPDAARQRLCELSTDIGHEEDPFVAAALAEEMASVWDGLDAWIKADGYLPKAWLAEDERDQHADWRPRS